MIHQCAWCGSKIREIEPLVDKTVSHGICDQCYKIETELSDLQKHHLKALKICEPENEIIWSINPLFIGYKNQEVAICVKL